LPWFFCHEWWIGYNYLFYISSHNLSSKLKTFPNIRLTLNSENIIFSIVDTTWCFCFEIKYYWCIKVICKVRKTQHQNLEFGYTQGEIKKNLQKNANQGVVKLRKPSILMVLSFILSFLFPGRLHYTTCTITVITLTPCALNVEFQHFILRFNKNFITLQIPLQEGIGGERRPKDRVTSRMTLLL
jgi:hypothetical protein